MVEQALHPFSDYRLYKVFHKKEGRWQAMLVKDESKTRTTMSYARYLMSVHLGRFLDKKEHVDHINGDKTDDRIENFQILTQKENSLKYVNSDDPSKKKKEVVLNCPICNTAFNKEVRTVKDILKRKPLSKFYCSRACSYIGLRKDSK